ncbi:hypothetical protein PIB30_014465 [Stylosanthes scabra]|uniref:Uncharacterized protein n=1 Tax=Stylosanthes scabra TaxID=79078 RepID=A0ABU6W9V8_9FABA|nr:hypothetical protein [Stylosanthes scabra]
MFLDLLILVIVGFGIRLRLRSIALVMAIFGGGGFREVPFVLGVVCSLNSLSIVSVIAPWQKLFGIYLILLSPFLWNLIFVIGSSVALLSMKSLLQQMFGEYGEVVAIKSLTQMMFGLI